MDPLTLAELGRRARSDLALQALLDEPYAAALASLSALSSFAAGQLLMLCPVLAARTLRGALAHPDADAWLNHQCGKQARSVIEALSSALAAHAELGGDEEDGDVFIEPPKKPEDIDDPPLDLPELREWAREHGVEDRLGDPAKVLSSQIYDPMFTTLHGEKTLAELLAAPRPAPPAAIRARMAKSWELDVRARADRAVREAVGNYLRGIAEIRAAVLLRRARAARMEPPAESPLAALHQRLQEARERVAGFAQARPLGTFRPRPAKVEIEPLRLVYWESDDHRWSPHVATVDIAVEADPIRARCSCPAGAKGPCAHLLAAFDEAIDFVRLPSADRDRLASILATPPWERFLRAFGEELGRRAPQPPEEEQRLAWRVTGEGLRVQLEPVLQKRLKGGGFSSGQRLDPNVLPNVRRCFTDPRDARAAAALSPGFDEGAYTHGSISRARVARTLDELDGHPLLFVQGSPAGHTRVTHARLSVALDPTEGGVSVAFAVGGERYEAAQLAQILHEKGPLITVDRAAGTVVICEVDERAEALIDAFKRHPARFPEGTYDDLLRALGALQESVDLSLPEALAGAPVEADVRPLVRLALRDEGDVEVEVLVRPLPGGPVLRPGAGAVTVLHSIDGRRVSARRDFAEEMAAASAIAAHLPASSAARWSHVLGEEAALDLLVALRDLGDAVVVEWAEPDKRLALTDYATIKELRVQVSDRRDWFGVKGKIDVDGHAVPLATLLEAVRKGRRYVLVAPGKFVALAEDLRRRLRQAGDVIHAGKQGLEVSLAGIPLLEELIEDPRVLEAAERFRGLVRRVAEARHLDPALPAGLTASLRPYQLEGYKWLMRLAAWGAGACLADDMGLGKTVQALAMLLARAERGPALVIAPTSVGQNWIDEAARFAPGLRARLYRGPGRAALLADLRPGDLLVTSYALLVRDAEALAEVRFATLVLDEAQAIKNALTRRANAVIGLDAELRVALTGTPVENHLGDLWSLMRVITPGLLGSWEHFHDTFAYPIERDRNPERRAALARVIRPFLLRRTKAEVTPELPPRIEIQRLVEPSAAERALYDAARLAALLSVAMAKGDGRFALLAALTRLRRLACHPRLDDQGSTVPSAKLAAFLEIVDELREEGHRALVFSQFTSHLALVREALDRRRITYDYLDGATPAEDRARRVTAFQKGRADLFLISLKAGGSGLNLTAADYVIHLDPWWNPAVEDQATDRAHRIGQSKAVTVIRLVARGTIEEAVLSLHGDKRALAAGIFDESASPGALSTEDLAALIRSGMGEPMSEDESDAAGDDGVSESNSTPPPPPVSEPAKPKGGDGRRAKKGGHGR